MPMLVLTSTPAPSQKPIPTGRFSSHYPKWFNVPSQEKKKEAK